MNIENYLKTINGKQPDIQGLVKNISREAATRGCAIFMYIDKKYKQLDAYNLQIQFTNNNPITELQIDIAKCDVKASPPLKNIIIVPISIYTEHLGIICLVDVQAETLSQNIANDIIRRITPYITIAQLIVDKLRIIHVHSKLCSDSSYSSKDLFLANLSHEIRTPLNGVVGYNQLLSQTPLTSTQRKYVSAMSGCSLQLTRIINDVLDFSKLASGKMEVNSECFSIREMFDSVMNTMSQKIKEKKQHLYFITDQNLPSFIIMDKQKLIQVIINLVSNANKFTRINGEIKISLSATVAQGENMLCVEVSDNGYGITELDQCKLFNSFTQIREHNGTGTGLGLAITKKLIDLMGGNISVSSIPGTGSKFIFTVKYEPYDFGDNMVTKYDISFLKDVVVLVVDDNADNRIFMSETLFHWNMKPVVCASALEALRMVLGNRYKFSLGLIDICMPGTSGSELAEQIKEERPYLPLIALSSLDSFVSSPNFNCVLSKPVNKVQLLNSICKMISGELSRSSFIGESYECLPPETERANTPDNNDIRILVAEDVVYNKTMLVSMLNTLKYQNICTANNGREAVNKITKAFSTLKQYDVLILDLRMPIMDGFEVIEALKQYEYSEHLHIVVVTASIMGEDKSRCKNLGVKYFINKPVDLNSLKEVMLHVCKTILRH